MIGNGADRHVLDRVSWFLEEERRLAGWIGAAFDRMRGVVTPDAIDAAHLKPIGLSRDRDGRRRNRKHRPRTGLRFGRPAVCGGTSQRQRARREDGSAVNLS